MQRLTSLETKVSNNKIRKGETNDEALEDAQNKSKVPKLCKDFTLSMETRLQFIFHLVVK